MNKLATALAMTALLQVLAAPGVALPIHGNIGVAGGIYKGGELQLRCEGVPFSLEGQLMQYPVATYGHWLAISRYALGFAPGHTVGLLGGYMQQWSPNSSGFQGYPLGAFYRYAWEGGWLQVSPYYTIAHGGNPSLETVLMTVLYPTVPYAEIGFRLASWCELSLRANLAPLKVSIGF